MIDSVGVDFSGIAFWHELLEEHLGAARASAGGEAAELLAAGARLGLEGAVALVLEEARVAAG